ncbi:LamG-like jellyroll fold [Beggiatoa sp. PS]|nr:LamG-like jellyroll fold [Beggiatoa sp. PS]
MEVVMKRLRYFRSVLWVFLAIGLFVFPISSVWADLNQGLILYYPFSGNADDASGNEFHGTVVGATSTTDRFGNPDSAYALDGEKSYIVAPIGRQSSSLTVSVWFNINKLAPDTQSIVTMGDEPKPDSSVYSFSDRLVIGTFGGKLTGSLWDATNDNVKIAGEEIVTTETWHHVVLTFEQATETHTLYLDGKAMGQYSGNRKTFSDVYLFLGSLQRENDRYEYFWGAMDDFRVYNRALPRPEVDELFGDGGSVPPPQPETTGNCPAPTTTASGDCMATYSLDGNVHIPCISVPDAFGGTTVYDVQMQQQSGAFTFDLDLNSVKPR